MSAAKSPIRNASSPRTSTLIWLIAAVLAGSGTAWGAAALVIKAGDPKPQNHGDPLYSYQAPR